jgi:hypothetical protein
MQIRTILHTLAAFLLVGVLADQNNAHADSPPASTEQAIQLSGESAVPKGDTNAGTLRINLKVGGNTLGTYEHKAGDEEKARNIVLALVDSNTINNYSASAGKSKTVDGVTWHPFRVKKRRNGTLFTLEPKDGGIVGVLVNQKKPPADDDQEQSSIEPSEIPPGFVGELHLFGQNTSWMTDFVTSIDCGIGCEVEEFAVLSDNHIVALINVSPDGPTGSEHVWVIGDYIDVDGKVITDVVLTSSIEPLVITDAAPVPTVSEWGLIILFLLLLTAGTIVIRRSMAQSQIATA